MSEIYFAQAVGGPIKIGFTTKCIEMRFRLLQYACPYELTLIGICDGDARREKEIHQKFRHLRIRGEWFNPGTDLLTFIAEQPHNKSPS